MKKTLIIVGVAGLAIASFKLGEIYGLLEVLVTLESEEQEREDRKQKRVVLGNRIHSREYWVDRGVLR